MNKGIITQIRELSSVILDAYIDEPSKVREFMVKGERLGGKEFSRWLLEQYPNKLGDFNTNQVYDGVTRFLRQKKGKVRRLSTSSEPELYTVRRDVPVSIDELLTIYIRSTDPDPTITKVTRLIKQIAYQQED